MTPSRWLASPNSSTPTLPRCPAVSSNGCWLRGRLRASQTFWCLDEPTSGVDLEHQRVLADVLAELVVGRHCCARGVARRRPARRPY